MLGAGRSVLVVEGQQVHDETGGSNMYVYYIHWPRAEVPLSTKMNVRYLGPGFGLFDAGASQWVNVCQVVCHDMVISTAVSMTTDMS